MVELIKYYEGDELAASTWKGKYALKGGTASPERTPNEMHWRMAYELGRVESKYWTTDKYNDELSAFGRKLHQELFQTSGETYVLAAWVFKYLENFKYVIPQGSIMSMLGNPNAIGSLSNCFVIPPPVDSYGGIFKTDQQIAQLEKRRGGVGTNLDGLRPDNIPVSNAAGTSTGAHSFMERFSNTTREVAQNGRRGALMLLMSCLHPDIFKFVRKKADRTKVTGANVSSMLTDEFMLAVEKDEDFICRWPVRTKLTQLMINGSTAQDYNTIYHWGAGSGIHLMKIKAKELYDEIVTMAWDNGEPGVAFIDRIQNYCPDGVYPQFVPIASNPCGEQWMQAYDACRLLALNFYNIVFEHFEEGARIDFDCLYEIAYIQQRLADDIVDLEIEYVNRIIKKVADDPEDESIKETELDLWIKVRDTARASRRTGCGFTALADMLAALNLKYDSDEAISVVEKVMKTKLKAELDCTIDMAIQRGTFEGWERNKEFYKRDGALVGRNPWYQMVATEFPEQAKRMWMHGRRNVSMSTVAPTGSLSIIAKLTKYANTSAGGEPHFSLFHFRNKKGNPGDENFRTDFIDQNGDHWMTYPVVMGGFKEWIDKSMDKVKFVGIENLPKAAMEQLYEKSPFYKSIANDIDWKQRIKMQSVIQHYTTNAVSSTLNLPNNVTKETVSNIYKEAWNQGLKGVTIYRDGCRTGVLTNEKVGDQEKRPKEVDSELNIVTVKGIKYGVIVGIVNDKPYEIFAFDLPEEIKDPCKGKVIKVKKGHYNFVCEDGKLKNLQEAAIHKEEQLLTRFLSLLLRKGATFKEVYDQIEKCDLEAVTFGKAIQRVLKKYMSEDDVLKGASCSSCGSTNLRIQEGCMACMDCGNSKCG